MFVISKPLFCAIVWSAFLIIYANAHSLVNDPVPPSNLTCLAPGSLHPDAPSIFSPQYQQITLSLGKNPGDIGDYDLCTNGTYAKHCMLVTGPAVYGICLPKNCHPPQDVKNPETGLLALLLLSLENVVFYDMDDAWYNCGDNSQALTLGGVLVIVLMLTLFVLVNIGTLFDAAGLLDVKIESWRSICCPCNLFCTKKKKQHVIATEHLINLINTPGLISRLGGMSAFPMLSRLLSQEGTLVEASSSITLASHQLQLRDESSIPYGTGLTVHGRGTTRGEGDAQISINPAIASLSSVPFLSENHMNSSPFSQRPDSLSLLGLGVVGRSRTSENTSQSLELGVLPHYSDHRTDILTAHSEHSAAATPSPYAATPLHLTGSSGVDSFAFRPNSSLFPSPTSATNQQPKFLSNPQSHIKSPTLERGKRRKVPIPIPLFCSCRKRWCRKFCGRVFFSAQTFLRSFSLLLNFPLLFVTFSSSAPSKRKLTRSVTYFSMFPSVYSLWGGLGSAGSDFRGIPIPFRGRTDKKPITEVVQDPKKESSLTTTSILTIANKRAEGKSANVSKWTAELQSELDSWDGIPSAIPFSFIPILEGVRVVCVLWLLLGATFVISMQPGYKGSGAIDPTSPSSVMSQFSFQPIASFTLAADTLLIISAWLGTRRMLGMARANKPWRLLSFLPKRVRGFTPGVLIRFCIRSAWRFIPMLTICLLIYSYLLPSIGSGPFWYAFLPHADKCIGRWGFQPVPKTGGFYGFNESDNGSALGLLSVISFLSNIYPLQDNIKDSCFPFAILISVLMQMRLILIPLIALLYLWFPVLGFISAFAIIVTSMINTAQNPHFATANGVPSGILSFDYRSVYALAPPPSSSFGSFAETTQKYWDGYWASPIAHASTFVMGILLALAIDATREARLRDRAERFAVYRREKSTRLETFAPLRGNSSTLTPYSALAQQLQRQSTLTKIARTLTCRCGRPSMFLPPCTIPLFLQWMLLSLALMIMFVCVFLPVTAYRSLQPGGRRWTAAMHRALIIYQRPIWALCISLIFFLYSTQGRPTAYRSPIFSSDECTSDESPKAEAYESMHSGLYASERDALPMRHRKGYLPQKTMSTSNEMHTQSANESFESFRRTWNSILESRLPNVRSMPWWVMEQFLSAPIWAPFARLSFAMGLVHPALAQFGYLSRTSLLRWSATSFFFEYLAYTAGASIVGGCLFFLVEVPFARIGMWAAIWLRAFLTSLRRRLYRMSYNLWTKHFYSISVKLSQYLSREDDENTQAPLGWSMGTNTLQNVSFLSEDSGASSRVVQNLRTPKQSVPPIPETPSSTPAKNALAGTYVPPPLPH